MHLTGNRSHRRELGWSIERLAEEVGLHGPYPGSVQMGERNISVKNIVVVASAHQSAALRLMRDLLPLNVASDSEQFRG